MQHPTLAQKLATLGANLRYEDLPPDVVDAAKKLILDTLGIIIAARHLDSSSALVSTLIELGGTPTSSVVGFSHKTSAPLAALANGTFAHSFDMDDDHRESGVHPSAVILPATYAMAESLNSDGKDFITAFIYGSEVDLRIGEALLAKSFFCGFHPTSICGVFGAAALAAKLLGMDEKGITSAMGIAGSQAGGIQEWKAEGSWTKRFHAGSAAKNGLLSAYCVKNGFHRAPTSVLEGTDGFLHAYSYRDDYDVSKITDKLGEVWRMAGTSIKVHACCRFAASPADASIIAHEKGIKPEEIENIHVKVNQVMLDMLTTPPDVKYHPQNLVHGQFSLPYIVACGIVKGQQSILEYTEEAVQNEEVIALAQKVTSEFDPEAEAVYPQYYPSTVIITKTDGTKETISIDYPKGDPENPVLWDEALEKFRFMAGFHLGSIEIERVIELVRNMETQESLQELFELLA